MATLVVTVDSGVSKHPTMARAVTSWQDSRRNNLHVSGIYKWDGHYYYDYYGRTERRYRCGRKI